MKRFYYILLAFALVFSSCEKQPEPNNGNNNNNNNNNNNTEQPGGNTTPQEPETNWTYYYVNNFAYDLMDTYYLWKKEIKAQLMAWKTDEEPIAKIKAIRYKDDAGNDIDKWTQATDDYKAFMGSVTGVTTTYGYDFYDFAQDKNNTNRVLATVRYVYPNSPASEAGLKRGDVIEQVNGKDILIIWQGTSGYLDTDFIYDQMVYSSSCTLTLSDGRKVSMTAREMVEDPVILYEVLEDETGTKKIGYLHYTSFTPESCYSLIEACQYFKSEGIKELILDLRYNGGGSASAEAVFISMLAPRANVEAEDIFEKEVYNTEYAAQMVKWYGEDAGVSRLSFQHNFKFDETIYNFNTENAHIGLEKIYAIITEDSASASESLICCLKPFIPVVTIGKQSHGKYCGGYIISTDDYFQDIIDYYTENTTSQSAEAIEFGNNGLKYAKNWGLYVMFSRYADKDGVTLCMPNGIKPDYSAVDNLKDGYQLGDPNESMLKIALRRADFKVPEQSSTQQQAPARYEQEVKINFQRREKPGMVKQLILPQGFFRDRQPQRISNDQYTPAE